MAQNNITLTTLTPLHIGSGKEYAGNFEFLYFKEAGKIVIVDDVKVLQIIGKEHIDEWVKVIDQKKNLYDFLKSYRHDLAVEDVAQYVMDAPTNLPTSSQSIKQFMQDGVGKHYIAGSSLKGAIRTALLTYLIKQEPAFVAQKKNLGVENRNSFNFKDSEIVKHYLGIDPNHDILRLLQVGDFYPTQASAETQCLKSGIMNLFNNGWNYKREQYGFVECLPAKTKNQGTIHINENLKKAIETKVREGKERNFLTQHFQHLTLPALFKIINDHTLELIESEIVFWEDEDKNEDIEDYLTILEDMKEIAKNITDKTCIMRVGAGSGWDFMTGGWAKAKDKNGEYMLEDEIWDTMKRSLRYKKSYSDDVIFPKTRKLSNNQPLGFVKLNY